MRVVIIKYNAGNIRSVDFALRRLGHQAVISDDPALIRNADRVIFPGVGEASSTMSYLKDRKMDQLLSSLTQPVLGICLGQQLMCTHSEEKNTSCIGIFDLPVLLFPSGSEKVPHMGWNSLRDVRGELFDSSLEGAYVYFVHSYFVQAGEATAATTDYILPFSAALQKDNFFATQFHPEKSGEAGAQILSNFLKL